MTLASVVTRNATVLPAGDLGDGSDSSGPQSIAASSAGAAETVLEPILSTYATTLPIHGIGLRVRARVVADGFAPNWLASAERISWETGAAVGSISMFTALPKDGSFAWCESTAVLTRIGGFVGLEWTAGYLNDLKLKVNTAWTPVGGAGTVTIDFVEAQVIVYGEQEADVHVVAVGTGTPPTRWVGTGTLPARDVGTPSTLPVRWVGDEEG